MKTIFKVTIFIGLLTLLALITIQEKAHNKTCDKILNTSEFLVDDLVKADCMNLDYLNTL